MPASQASLLAVWGGALGETPIASGAHSGGSTLLQFAELRRAFRAASKSLHPDVVAAAGGQGQGAELEGQPTIYELNQAYETVLQLL